jgi:sulfite reductase (NADPH) flavoprotein alpha-component
LNSIISLYSVAFSRDSKKKVYVQDLMADEAVAKDLVSLVRDQGAYVYVCGATAMGSDVMTAFTKILQQHGGCGKAKETLLEPEAIKFVKDLQDSGRYVQELWTA